MKRLLGATSVAVLLAAVPALAQDAANDPLLNNSPQTEEGVNNIQIQWIEEDGQVLSDDLIGTEVFDSNGESIGEIDNLVVALNARGGNAPKPGAIVNPDAVNGASTEMSATETAPTEELPGGDQMAAGEPAPLTQDDMASDEQDTASAPTASDPAGEELPADNMAATDEPTMEGEGDAMDTATADEPLTETDSESTDMVAAPATDGEPMSEDDSATSEVAEAPATEELPADQVAEAPAADSGVTTMEPSSERYSDVSVSAAVIGVGGFLGLGEKNVAVSIDQLQFFNDGNGNRRIVLDVTRDQLDAAPEFARAENGEVDASTVVE